MSHHTFVLAAGIFTDAEIEKEHLAGQPVVVKLAALTTPDEVERATADTDGVIVAVNPLPKELIDSFGPNVRVIGRAGIGLDAIDLEEAKRRGIGVVHTPDYATNEVATHAVALILAVHRRLVQGDMAARRSWTAWRQLAPFASINEQTAGVVGTGRIGRAVIERLRPLVREIVAYDPYAPPLEGTTTAPSLEELLRRSDILTLHMPLTPETDRMIGARELALLKGGAIVVNVSRGKLIDQEALVRALEDGHLAGAGLDVLEEEPPPEDAPILRAPNVVLSPHFAWYSASSERRMRTDVVDAMIDYLEHRPLRKGRLAVDPAVSRSQ
jgi:D-3-phosphoglycerate dehydrogenase